jgi:signal transduction histidine kinase
MPPDIIATMKARRRTRPRFIWQGALIILPAFLLAAAGLHSLHQDELFAAHEAAREAHRHAAAIAEIRLPEQLFTRPTENPSDQLFKTGVLMRVNEHDELIHPAPMAQRRAPEPLELNELNEAQHKAWNHWLEAAETTEPAIIEAAIGELTKTQPPDRWIALARFRSACVARDRHEEPPRRAATLFQAVLESHPDAAGETGLPLSIVSALELAKVSPTFREAGLPSICAHIVAQPEAFTEVVLDLATALNPACAPLRDSFRQDERARAFYQTMIGAAPSGKVLFELEKYFVLSRPRDAAGARELIAISSGPLESACARAIASQTLPAHFAARISLPSSTGPATNRNEPLARVETSLPTFRGELPVRVEVSLANPDQFYAQQRARTTRTAVLIVASALTVLIGFFAAWHAFRKQQQLSELKTNFVSSVSHELRAPIASMRLMAEELEQGAAPSQSKLREYHHFIGQECRRLSALVENVLDFSRREQGRESFEFAPADLAQVVRETIGIMSAYARERRVDLLLTVEGDAGSRVADSGALQRLLVNLLDNAIKHSPPDGSVAVRAAFSADGVRLSVTDHGAGIAHSELARIFERFYRVGSELRRETTGVGLGLAIVKEIAEAHGGTVEVSSAPGAGSTFTVLLPLVALPDARPDREVASIA